MLHVMDGDRASPLYRHPVREAIEGYTVNRVHRISRIGLYQVNRVYRVYRIRLQYTQLNISEAEAHNWNPHLLNYREIAALVYKLFGNCAKTETQVQIFNAINTFNFGWRIEDREVEEESYANLCKLVTDHYGPLLTVTAEVHQTILKLIYKKLPGHTKMHKLYTDKTKIDIDDNGPDTITRARDRYLSKNPNSAEYYRKSKGLQSRQ